MSNNPRSGQHMPRQHDDIGPKPMTRAEVSAFECGAPNKTYTLSDSRGGTLGEHCRRRVAKEGDRCPAHRRTMTAPKKGTFLEVRWDGSLRGSGDSWEEAFRQADALANEGR